MPFDDTNYRDPPDPAPPPPPTRSRKDEPLLLAVFAGLAFLLLLLPISADGLNDLVHYLARR